VNPSVSVNVWQPNWSSKTLGGAVYYKDFTLYAGPLSDWFNPLDGTSRGMNWDVRFTDNTKNPCGANTGTFEVVQLVTPFRTYTSRLDNTFYDNHWNSKQGLDTSYPYGGYQCGAPYYNCGDSPVMGTPITYSHAAMADSFEDYLMYLPPGSKSQYVPIGYFYWKIYADTDIGAPNPCGTISPVGYRWFDVNNDWPDWTQVITANDVTNGYFAAK
jgi:hypothetical protein